MTLKRATLGRFALLWNLHVGHSFGQHAYQDLDVLVVRLPRKTVIWLSCAGFAIASSVMAHVAWRLGFSMTKTKASASKS